VAAFPPISGFHFKLNHTKSYVTCSSTQNSK